jgi:hypothetical protein
MSEFHGDEPEQQADEREARERKWDEDGDEE